MTANLLFPEVIKGADLSDDGVYRYSLTRIWSGEGPMVTWVMLNPSTADADVDDPTIRRCMAFARSWDASGIRVVNLFALRATDPKQINRHHSPLGERNATAIMRAISEPDTAFVVAAWGAGNPYPNVSSIGTVRTHAQRSDRALLCLGITKSGAPKHPLYVRGDHLLEPWGGD